MGEKVEEERRQGEESKNPPSPPLLFVKSLDLVSLPRLVPPLLTPKLKVQQQHEPRGQQSCCRRSTCLSVAALLQQRST